MAGDWIKMRNDLADDPAVIGIAARLGIDEFAVVGRLQYLWAWVDSQSRDGHAAGVTGAWLDRKVQRDGFAQAMVDVAWLVVTPDGIEIPNFDRHNGETAKTRALGTKRKQKQRASVTDVPQPAGQVSRTQRDKSETREEKRREEHTEPNGSDAHASPTDRDMVFANGVALLTAAGLVDKNARSFLAAQCKAHGEAAVKAALDRCAAERPIQPVPWLTAALGPANASTRPRKSDTLMAGNIAAAHRFLTETPQ